jgi:hypothetical protein
MRERQRRSRSSDYAAPKHPVVTVCTGRFSVEKILVQGRSAFLAHEGWQALWSRCAYHVNKAIIAA